MIETFSIPLKSCWIKQTTLHFLKKSEDWYAWGKTRASNHPQVRVQSKRLKESFQTISTGAFLFFICLVVDNGGGKEVSCIFTTQSSPCNTGFPRVTGFLGLAGALTLNYMIFFSLLLCRQPPTFILCMLYFAQSYLRPPFFSHLHIFLVWAHLSPKTSVII